jgi:acyl-coenzyme A thioesterase PaaI-like protein
MTDAGAQIAADEGALRNAVPFARTLGLSVHRVGPDADGMLTAVVELPDADGMHNHVGGPHAGAQFTLGETASGSIVMAAFADQFHRAVPLTVRAEIRFRKLAMGTVRATARLARPAGEVVADAVAQLDAGVRPEFDVHVEISTLDGTPTAEMTVVWTLRPHR